MRAAADELGIAADDRQIISLEGLVDLAHVVAERGFEQRLGAQVVPEPVHWRSSTRVAASASANRSRARRRSPSRDDLVVALHAARLVAAHAVGDQLDLVAEVVVQHPVREPVFCAISRRLVRA